MINLMYLVFIAMMALNVSSEVLDGFELVESSLRLSTENLSKRNIHIQADFDRAYQANAEKVGEWHEKGTKVKTQSDELYHYIDELKLRIVQETDGDTGDITHIKHKDDLEAASRVMLAPIVGEGKKLKERLDQYRNNLCTLIDDPSKQAVIQSMLNTTAPKKNNMITVSWENALFENMPVAAAITLLTKIQNDIRDIEGEVLTTLLTNVDIDDYRVNKIEALVIPKSQIVASGIPFEAQIVLAAIDSTQQPQYYLHDTPLPNNQITVPTRNIGQHTITGKVIADGHTYPYETKYSVTETSAIIAPVLMNFLYEHIENPIRLAIPGVPSGAIQAQITRGTITQKDNNIWIVHGLDLTQAPQVTITLTASIDGRTTSASQEFTIRRLPDPLPFISYKDPDGNTRRFTGGTPLAKRHLIEATAIEAAIDDGLLDIPYQVTGFTMSTVDNMNNYVPEVSNSAQFTPRQKLLIRDMARGKRFYISNVKVTGPGGKTLTITYPLEVIIN
jgi:gliding motility-associated protein GldM